VTPLQETVREAFAPGGVLSRAADHFHPRSGQTEMALAVARVVEQGGALVVEAGTGVGKTFSYLVPALLSGERILLSTATKTLQDQLFGRDLPRLVQALGLPVRTALLKGRSSYLCTHRMELARQDATLPDRTAVRTLAKVEEWARITRTGDLAELPGLDERSPVIPLITSTRDNCLGSTCPKFRACHVNQARREALAADVVVINHHLFFADLAVRESGMAELLPTVRVAIFDEAHQLNETGVQFLGAQLSTGQVIDFARDMLGAGMQLARGLADWQHLVGDRARGARPAPGGGPYRARRPRALDRRVRPSRPSRLPGDRRCRPCRQACSDAMVALDTVSEMAPDFVRLHERAATAWRSAPEQFAGALRAWLGTLGRCGNSNCAWLSRRWTSPARCVARSCAQDAPPAADETRRSWIFTSATLGDDARLRWFTEPCGLTELEVLQVESPFDYAVQAAVYVPRELPKPNDPAHSAQVARLAGDAAQRLGGATMVLTTTLRALRAIGEALQARFDGSLGRSRSAGAGPTGPSGA
jgi:ATP-dependent DNA helicase DinG